MKKKIAIPALFVLALICFFSCKKENNDDAVPVPAQTTGNTINTTLTGRVMDQNNNPIAGVVVNAGGQSTTTNQFGIFLLKNTNVNKNRCVMDFTKSGYFYRQHCISATANSVNYARVILLSNAPAYTVQSAIGGTVTIPGGSNVVFQPNSFVTANGSAYSGTVSVAVKHLLPGSANFGFTIPGGDLQGLDAGNDAVALYSYGMLGVELTGSSGQSLQLASGKPATLSFAIAASQQATAPATIAMWHYDEAAALWKEEGVATKTGNTYVGTVNHFSWWNCDFPGGVATVKGKVVDCNGNPISNVMVSITANNGYTTYPLTNQNGEYSFVIAANFTATAQFQSSLNPPFSQNSLVENIPLLSRWQVFSVPDLVVQCPSAIIGTAQTCSGENSEAMVLLKINNTLADYRYTTTGAFKFFAPDNTNFQLEAFNSTSTTTVTGTSLASSNILNVGNILMCDNVNLSDNSFILNSSNIPSQLFNIIFTASSAYLGDTNQSTFTTLYWEGTTPTGYTINSAYISANDTIPGTTTCALNINITNANGTYYIYGQNISCNLTQIGPIGGKIKGTYNGAVTTYANGSNATGSITGNFSITRTQ